MMTSPVPEAKRTGSKIARHLLAAARLLVGYILAVAAGSLVGAITGAIFPSLAILPDSTEYGLAADILQTAFMFFILGATFGLPYVILGTIIFWRWLPKSMWLFLAIGALCPPAAIVLTLSFIGSLHWLSADDYGFMALTIPAGVVAAYVYGAIGMGYGFGRWRFG